MICTCLYKRLMAMHATISGHLCSAGLVTFKSCENGQLATFSVDVPDLQSVDLGIFVKENISHFCSNYRCKIFFFLQTSAVTKNGLHFEACVFQKYHNHMVYPALLT